MRPWTFGLWHLRRGPATALMVVSMVGIVWAFPEVVIGVSIDPALRPRGIGAPELSSVALAGALPALTVPCFDRRELLGGVTARAMHTAYSVAVRVLPLLVFPIWVLRVHQVQPEAELPPVWGLAQTSAVVACLGWIACLLLGRAWGVFVPLATFAGLAAGQHLYPDSPLTWWFATGRNWHTAWWAWAGALATAVVVIWWTRSIPRPDRKR